jgi:hypothetical protein
LARKEKDGQKNSNILGLHNWIEIVKVEIPKGGSIRFFMKQKDFDFLLLIQTSNISVIISIKGREPLQ